MEGASISAETRAGIIDWLFQVQQYLGLTDPCVHAAVANFDRALAAVHWEHDEVQLLALAALQLAAKVEEDTPPAPSLLLPLAGGVYTAADLARVELEVLGALDWRLRNTTAAVFLQFYADIAGKGRKPVFRLARALLDLCLAQDWYGCTQPSYLASCCLGAAAWLTDQQQLIEQQPWCEQLARATGSSWEQLLPGIKLCLHACTQTKNEGFQDKHAKSSKALRKQKQAILGLAKGLESVRTEAMYG